MEAVNPVLVESVRRPLSIMLTVILAALVLTVFAGVFITRSITAPPAEAVKVAEQVAEGDLDARIAVGSQDETGQLLTSLKAMVAALKRMAEAATAIANGDLTVKVSPQSERDALGNALAAMAGPPTPTDTHIRPGATGLSSASAQGLAAAQT